MSAPRRQSGPHTSTSGSQLADIRLELLPRNISQFMLIYFHRDTDSKLLFLHVLFAIASISLFVHLIICARKKVVLKNKPANPLAKINVCYKK